MEYKNTKTHFGVIAIAFHWIMAVVIMGMLALGLYMVTLPSGLEKLKLYGWHKEYGVIVLLLALLRFFWRIRNITPHLSLPRFELVTARLVHWAFYGLMIAMPLSGWMMSSAAGRTVSFFGLFNLPALVNANENLAGLAHAAHQWFGYTLVAMILLHTAAALKHHFYDKDDILRRMIS